MVVVVAPRPVSWSGLVQRTRVVAAVTVAGRTVPTAEGVTLAQARAFGTRLAFTFRAYVDVQPCRLQHCSFEKKRALYVRDLDVDFGACWKNFLHQFWMLICFSVVGKNRRMCIKNFGTVILVLDFGAY